MQFATEHEVALTGMNAIGDLTGVSGEALGNKMVDILYKLNPAQWTELAARFQIQTSEAWSHSSASSSVPRAHPGPGYEKYGTSMTGGCLQLVIQMPILFALYRIIYKE